MKRSHVFTDCRTKIRNMLLQVTPVQQNQYHSWKVFITWSSAVTAVVVSRHPSNVLGDRPGQILHAALPASSASPLPIQSYIQSLLLTVAEHRDPPELTRRQTKHIYYPHFFFRINRNEVLISTESYSKQRFDSRYTFSFVFSQKVVGPIICRTKCLFYNKRICEKFRVILCIPIMASEKILTAQKSWNYFRKCSVGTQGI